MLTRGEKNMSTCLLKIVLSSHERIEEIIHLSDVFPLAWLTLPIAHTHTYFDIHGED